MTIILSDLNRFIKKINNSLSYIFILLRACFAVINVSQGNAATYATCGETINVHLTTNLPRNLPVIFFKLVTEFWSWVCGPTYFGPRCGCCQVGPFSRFDITPTCDMWVCGPTFLFSLLNNSAAQGCKCAHWNQLSVFSASHIACYRPNMNLMYIITTNHMLLTSIYACSRVTVCAVITRTACAVTCKRITTVPGQSVCPFVRINGIIIIIIIIAMTMFMVLSSWPKSLREFTRFI